MKWDELMPYLSKSFSTMGAGMGDEGSVGRNLGSAGADMADSAIMTLMQKKAQEKAEKEKKGALGGSLGSTLGAIAGYALAPATGGASLALSTGLGAGLGSATGQALGGGKIDMGEALKSGLTSGATTAVAPVLLEGAGLPSMAGKMAEGATKIPASLAGGIGNQFDTMLLNRGMDAILGNALAPKQKQQSMLPAPFGWNPYVQAFMNQ